MGARKATGSADGLGALCRNILRRSGVDLRFAAVGRESAACYDANRRTMRTRIITGSPVYLNKESHESDTSPGTSFMYPIPMSS